MRNAQNIAQDMVAEKRRQQKRWGDVLERLILLGMVLSVAGWLALLAYGMAWVLGIW